MTCTHIYVPCGCILLAHALRFRSHLSVESSQETSLLRNGATVTLLCRSALTGTAQGVWKSLSEVLDVSPSRLKVSQDGLPKPVKIITLTERSVRGYVWFCWRGDLTCKIETAKGSGNQTLVEADLRDLFMLWNRTAMTKLLKSPRILSSHSPKEHPFSSPDTDQPLHRKETFPVRPKEDNSGFHYMLRKSHCAMSGKIFVADVWSKVKEDTDSF